MKVCNVCGETYQNLVEFCFVDGVVLDLAADAMDVPVPSHLPMSGPPVASVPAAASGPSSRGLVSTAEVPSFTPMADRVTESVEVDPEADADTIEGAGAGESAVGHTLVPELSAATPPVAPSAAAPDLAQQTGRPAEDDEDDGVAAVPLAVWSAPLLLGGVGVVAVLAVVVAVMVWPSGSDTVVIEPKVVPATAPSAAAAAPSPTAPPPAEPVEAEDQPVVPEPEPEVEDGEEAADANDPSGLDAAEVEGQPEAPEQGTDGVAVIDEPAPSTSAGDDGPEPTEAQAPEPEAAVEETAPEPVQPEVAEGGDAPEAEASPEAATVEPVAARTGPVIIFHQGHTGQVVQVNGGSASGDLPFRTELANGSNTFVIVLADGETIEMQRTIELKPPGQTTLIHLDR